MTEKTTRGDASRRGAANVATALSGRLATQAVLTVTAFVLPRLMGAESYGHYAAIMAVVVMTQTLSSLGLPLVEFRFLAPAWRRGSRADAVELGSTIWVTRLGLALAAGAVAAAWLARSGDLASSTAVVATVGALAAIRSAYEATRSLFLSTGHVRQFVLFDLLRALLVLAVVAVCFLLLGLDAVFTGLLAGFALLLAAAAAALRAVFPLDPTKYRWSALRPHISYAAGGYVGLLSETVQTQFSIYVVAVWVARSEAGVLALTLQIMALLQGLYISGRTALMPILSELEAAGEQRRLREWGSLMMRAGAAMGTLACIGWAIVGGDLLGLLLPSEFAPVHLLGTVILFAVALFCCAAACNVLLLVRGRSRVAATNSGVYAAVTVGGVLLALQSGPGVAGRIVWVYAAAAAVYFTVAYFSLALSGGLWLPLRRTLMLLAPAAIAWPVLIWQAPPPIKVVAAIVATACYVGYAVALRLLPRHELVEVMRLLRRPKPDAS